MPGRDSDGSDTVISVDLGRRGSLATRKDSENNEITTVSTNLFIVQNGRRYIYTTRARERNPVVQLSDDASREEVVYVYNGSCYRGSKPRFANITMRGDGNVGWVVSFDSSGRRDNADVLFERFGLESVEEIGLVYLVVLVVFGRRGCMANDPLWPMSTENTVGDDGKLEDMTDADFMIQCEHGIGKDGSLPWAPEQDALWGTLAVCCCKVDGTPLACRLSAPRASPLRTVLKYACRREPGLMQCKLRTVLGGMRHTEEDLPLLPFLPAHGETLGLGIPSSQFHPFLVSFTSSVFSPTISTTYTNPPLLNLPSSTCPAWLLPVPSASSDRIGSRKRSEISERSDVTLDLSSQDLDSGF